MKALCSTANGAFAAIVGDLWCAGDTKVNWFWEKKKTHKKKILTQKTTKQTPKHLEYGAEDTNSHSVCCVLWKKICFNNLIRFTWACELLLFIVARCLFSVELVQCIIQNTWRKKRHRMRYQNNEEEEESRKKEGRSRERGGKKRKEAKREKGRSEEGRGELSRSPSSIATRDPKIQLKLRGSTSSATSLLWLSLVFLSLLRVHTYCMWVPIFLQMCELITICTAHNRSTSLCFWCVRKKISCGGSFKRRRTRALGNPKPDVFTFLICWASA